MCFDIVEFYPSISESLLLEAISFAQQYVHVSEQDRGIILHARKTLLFGDGDTWSKKTGLFDVPVGCYDGAEICELVAVYALTKLANVVEKQDVGLYRDDGLAVLRNTNGREADRMRKRIIEIFKDMGLRITIETNLKIVNFLDITLNLNNGKVYPYRKPNDKPVYVHSLSDHPSAIINNIPDSINRRLTDISSDETIFEEATPPYEEALKASGYENKMEFLSARKESKKKSRNNRPRQIIWFSPPFSKSVSTNVGRRFRSLLKKHFPQGSALGKIFNDNNVKVSYGCMPNLAKIIKNHNHKVLSKQSNGGESGERSCNCRRKAECPLRGACQMKSIVYKATVTSENDSKIYYGLTENTCKQRYNNHTQSIRHEKYEHSTELSRHLWTLKREGKAYDID